MKMVHFAKSYKTAAIKTATPGHLVLMLYDGALRFMATALCGFAEENVVKRVETVHNNLTKAQSILRELQMNLDMEAGGEFAQRMFALYDFMVIQIQEANLKKDPEPIRVVERLLGEIRNAWAQMLERTDSTNRAA